MSTWTFVPLGAGKGQGSEDWDNAFQSREYASKANAIRCGLVKASPGQYALYESVNTSDGGTGYNDTVYRGVAYRRA